MSDSPVMGLPGALPTTTMPTLANGTCGAGAMLRTAREAQGLHIAALAVSLKVPVKKLEALEADRFDLLPDVVFVRALTLSVCRTLKLDPKTVMSALPQRQSPQMKTDLDGLNTTFQAPGPFSGFSWRQALSPVGLSIAALLIVIVAIAFWPTHFAESDSAAAPVVPTDTVEQGAVPMPRQPTGMQESASVPEPVKLADSPILSAMPDPVLSAASEPMQVVPGSTSDAVLVLQAKGASWVEVTDTAGTMLLRKVTSAGEVLPIAAKLPLFVVLGRADMVSVLVRGKPMDVSSLSKNNVARFEVN
jgi:cytoskeleton protein RodZ